MGLEAEEPEANAAASADDTESIYEKSLSSSRTCASLTRSIFFFPMLGLLAAL